MPEVTVTDTPIAVRQKDGSPIGCSLCQAVEGPFVVVGQATFNVQTPEGPLVVDEPLVLCAPRVENDTVIRQGCVGTIALAVGYTSPDVLAKSQEMQKQLLGRVARVEAERDALKDSQVQVVPVKDLMNLIETTGAGRGTPA